VTINNPSNKPFHSRDTDQGHYYIGYKWILNDKIVLGCANSQLLEADVSGSYTLPVEVMVPGNYAQCEFIVDLVTGKGKWLSIKNINLEY
jgi:hypothetical protein